MNQLVLTPQDPVWQTTNAKQVSQALLDAGFIVGETFSHEGRTHYHAGERFLELMTFVGCAPVVMTGQESMENLNFYHVYIAEAPMTPRLLLSRDARPRCRKCKTAVDEWQLLLREYEQSRIPKSVSCTGCGSQNTILSFDWKRAGGAVGVYVAVHGVFPHEAIPADELMNQLQKISGIGWNYFYYS